MTSSRTSFSPGPFSSRGSVGGPEFSVNGRSQSCLCSRRSPTAQEQLLSMRHWRNERRLELEMWATNSVEGSEIGHRETSLGDHCLNTVSFL